MKAIGTMGLMTVLLLSLGATGCGEGEEKTKIDPKQGWEMAASTAKAPVGVIAAYRVHLDVPEAKGKYEPKERSDLQEATYYAANAIRHKANEVRQKALLSGSDEFASIAPAFAAVSRDCATPDNDEDVVECKKTLDELAKALDEAAGKAEQAGVSSFPKLTEEAADEAAKKAIQPFVEAKGPSEAETKLFATMADEAATPDAVLSACRVAINDAGGVVAKLESEEEDLKEVAIRHKLKMEAWCNRMAEMASYMVSLDACEKDASTKDCKELCAKAKRRLKQGVLAAAFEPLVPKHEEICEEE